jgi:hypothetical protein
VNPWLRRALLNPFGLLLLAVTASSMVGVVVALAAS